MKNLTLLFLVRKSDVLLAMKKRGFGEGRWNGVGGKVEENETIEDATIRECQEEISVTPIKITKTAEIIFYEFHDGKKKSFKVTVFVSSNWSGNPVETEEMSPKWFNINDLPYDSMWPDDKFWLGHVLKGERVKATFTLDENDNITSHDLELVNQI